MNYKALDISLKVFFLCVSAFLAADMVNTISRRAIHTLPSFTIPKRVKKQFIPPAPPLEERAETPLPQEAAPLLKLIGTTTGAYPYVVIINPANNTQELYKISGDVGNGWLIHEIGKDTVVLKKGNIKEIIEAKFVETEPLKQKEAGRRKDIVSTGKGVRLDQREVEMTLSDLNKVMTQARVVPNMIEGKTSGYRIFNIIPQSIYTKMGLMNNDIVERVNGVEIKSPDTLYQLFHQIKNERKITLDLSRGGKRESINIEIL